MIGSLLPYPFELAFMQRALVAGMVVGTFAPMIGTYLVQKRLSLIGDGIGHVAFAGVGIGLRWASGRSGPRWCLRSSVRSRWSGSGHVTEPPATSPSHCSSTRGSRSASSSRAAAAA